MKVYSLTYTPVHEGVSIYMVGNERYYIVHYCIAYGPGSRSRYSDSLWSGRSGDRIPVGVTLSAPTQTGPYAPPSLLCSGCRVSFPGIKRPGRGVNHPHLSSAKVEEILELFVYSPSRASWRVLGWNFLVMPTGKVSRLSLCNTDHMLHHYMDTCCELCLHIIMKWLVLRFSMTK